MKELRGIAGVLVLVVLRSVFFVFVANGQDLSQNDLEKQSLIYFKKSDYINAANGFKKLISFYPKEESFNYYLGRCNLHTSHVNEYTIKLLEFAASRNFNTDVYYYLALAYYKMYAFEEAESAIKNFIGQASKKEIKKLKPQILVQSIDLARTETVRFENVEVLSSEELKMPKILSKYSEFSGGIFLHKTRVFNSASDLKKQFNGIMYFPNKAVKGTILYYPGSGRKSGTDIFQAEQLGISEYSQPDPLSVINSKYNEDYPFFDCRTNTLYFSSDRPGGLGGYDIYMSVLDLQTNRFSEPKRKEFPVNSAYDDFLYVTDSSGSKAMLVSDRVNIKGEFTVYQIDISGDRDDIVPQSADDRLYYSSLPVRILKKDQITRKEQILSVSTERSETTDTKLQEAMEYQLKCDSLQNLILMNKSLLRKESDENIRKIYFSVIAKAQKDIKTYQNKADILFSESEILKETDRIKHSVQEPEEFNLKSDSEKLTQKDKKVEDLTQYHDKTEEKTDVKSNRSENSPVVSKNTIYSFSILERSPYSDENPIPEDFTFPEGLIYRIQLGAYNDNLPADAFGGLTPLSSEKIPTSKLTKYYVGVFESSKEARSALEQVKSLGFNDAFIVSYYNQQKIAIQAAREIEFGKKK